MVRPKKSVHLREQLVRRFAVCPGACTGGWPLKILLPINLASFPPHYVNIFCARLSSVALNKGRVKFCTCRTFDNDEEESRAYSIEVADVFGYPRGFARPSTEPRA
jgi:hypothetical protein